MSEKLTQSSDERYTVAIRRHVFEGIPLMRALREAGFAESYSRRSKNDLLKVSKPFAAAWRFVEAEQRARRFEGHSKDCSPENVAGQPDQLKAMVKGKLVENIQKGVDGGVRSANLLSRFKEHDWLVKDGGDNMQIGIFPTLAGYDPTCPAIKALANHNTCSWCGEDFDDTVRFQVHSVECPKRPISQALPALEVRA
jgi:hypothetical protein